MYKNDKNWQARIEKKKKTGNDKNDKNCHFSP
jgi:hypothetical protein